MILFLITFLYLSSTFASAAYKDDLARRIMMPMAAAAYSDLPEDCVSKLLGSSSFGSQVTVSCDSAANDRCSGFTALSHQDNAIIIAFRGSSGFLQLAQEASGEIFSKPTPFFTGGSVSPYFLKAFNSVWNGGLRDSFLSLKNKYPSYKIFVTGHSLGGSMACLCAASIVKSGYITADKVSLYTMGEPRVGDESYVKNYDNLNIESYRIIHNRDMVPHLPPDGLFGYKHHKMEIFYENNMVVGSSFKTCPGDDDNNCSNVRVDLSINDHLHYFNKDVSDYGESGCKA
uniref:Lipase_3 domain-containing protein n=1 Tax=Parastrongyloides trichosuri TaxID=131310 RepID=A0A0N4Z5H9_PARTI